MTALRGAAALAVAAWVSGCFPAETPLPPAPAVAADLQAPAARGEAVFAIADAGTDADAAVVGGALADPDPLVRRSAVVALTGYDGDVPASLLALALNDPDPRIRLDAVEALGQNGGQAARLALRQALGDPDERVREAALEMLREPARP